MINNKAAFCKIRRIHGMCFQCERHIRHECNNVFIDDDLEIKEYTPIKSKIQGLVCTGWIVYPQKA